MKSSQCQSLQVVVRSTLMAIVKAATRIRFSDVNNTIKIMNVHILYNLMSME
jgi:hypothetical protein